MRLRPSSDGMHKRPTRLLRCPAHDLGRRALEQRCVFVLRKLGAALSWVH